MMCVECGRDAPELVDGSCAACFAAKNPLLEAPEVFDVEVCVHCQARRRGTHWMEAPEGTPPQWIREDALREAVRVHPAVEAPRVDFAETVEDARNFRIQVRLEGYLAGEEVTGEEACRVRIKNGVCNRCSRIQGGYYAALLQLRATERDVTQSELETAHAIVADGLDRAQVAGNRFAFLAKSGAIHGGFDYYLGDIDAARDIARTLKERLGAAVQETAKLVGRKEGEDVYRVTFLVRIHRFAPGDFATYDHRLVQVHGIHSGNAQCTDLETYRRIRVPENALRRYGGPEEVHQAIFVSQGPEGLQVLDPVDQRVQAVLPPPGWSGGETVPVVRYEERLYGVPTATEASDKS